MGESSSERGAEIVSLEPRHLGLGEVFYRTREAVVVAEASAGRIVLWNDSAVRLFGYSQQEAVGLLVEDLVPEALKGRHRAGLAHYAREGRGDLIDSGSPVELPAVRKDGAELWVEMSLTPLQAPGVPARYAMAIVRDTTERKLVDDELRRTQEELSATVEQLQRRTRELTLINELGDRLQTCASIDEASDVIGAMAARLFPNASGALYLFAPSRDVHEATCTWGESPPAENRVAPGDCWALRRGRAHIVERAAEGSVCPHVQSEWTSYLCVPMVAQADTLGLFHLRTVPRDEGATVASASELGPAVAEHLALALANFRLRETLRNQSIRDPLTDLYNRRYMEESLEREVRRAARHGLSLAVIAIDIDHFKPFNDTYGHEAGDTMLRTLADFFHANVRGEDIACRQGGEEFLLILPYASLQQAATRAEQLRIGTKALTVLPHTAAVEQSVTISLGVAAHPEHGTTSADLLRAADAALYRAKAQGRDRVVVG